MGPHEERTQSDEKRLVHGLVHLFILGLIRTHSPFIQRKAHLKLALFSKCGIPTRRASHFHWGRQAYRTLHIGFEQEHAGIGLEAVVGGRRDRSPSGWAGQKADEGILQGNAYFMRGAVKGMARIHVRSWGIGKSFAWPFVYLAGCRLAESLNILEMTRARTRDQIAIPLHASWPELCCIGCGTPAVHERTTP